MARPNDRVAMPRKQLAMQMRFEHLYDPAHSGSYYGI
jgi:hypothetical protein